MGVAQDTLDKMIKALEELLNETTDEIARAYIETELHRLRKFKELISEEQ